MSAEAADNPGRALIVESASDPGALAASRALRAAGWTVGVASSHSPHLAAASNSVSHRHRITGPAVNLNDFVAGVNAAIDSEGYDVVFPGWGDAETIALSMRREEIDAIVPFCAHDQLLRVFDKLALGKAATDSGIRVPETRLACEATLSELHFPLLVKPRLHSPLSKDGGPTRMPAAVATNPTEARSHIDRIRSHGGEPILQDWISGQLGAFIAVTDRDSRILARAQQLSERTWPPDAGRTARAISTPVDEELSERVQSLLRNLGWRGLVQIQFIFEPSSSPKLIDFNGRFFGSLSLAIAGGPNLPAIWAASATGQTPPPGGDAPPGYRYQSLDSDLRRARAERRGGLLRDVRGCLQYASRADAQDLWDRRDPFPLLRQNASIARSFGKRRVRMLRSALSD